MKVMRELWLCMFTPPWRPQGHFDTPYVLQVILWAAGWGWSILGLILGSFLAPSILAYGQLTSSAYQDWATYFIAVLAAFVVQVVSYFMFLPLFVICYALLSALFVALFHGSPGEYLTTEESSIWSWILESLSGLLIGCVVLGGEGFALWWYVKTHGTHQGIMSTFVLGGFVIKAVFIPAIKSLIAGIIIGRFFKWLRGGKGTAAS